MKTSERLTIGAVSEQAMVNIETIRYYERIGLLPKPPHSVGGHRLYAYEHKQRLLFIRRARELGFSLGQVRTLLGITNGRRRVTCAKVETITKQHIADIRKKMEDLKRLERILSTLVVRCRGDESPDCPILHALAQGALGGEAARGT
jgi:MerR family mercuric resistance operon transcriptional regulator